MDQELILLLGKWQIKAENDLKTIETLFSATEIITDSICFHAQQAVEKYLKLYLVYKNIPPDKTHKIELLLKRCIELDNDFVNLKEADILSEYAVELRYPDDFSVPSEEEAREAYLLAMEVRDFVKQKVFIEEES